MPRGEARRRCRGWLGRQRGRTHAADDRASPGRPERSRRWSWRQYGARSSRGEGSGQRPPSDGHLQAGRRAGAHERELHFFPDAVWSEEPHHLAHPDDRCAIPGRDHVTQQQSAAPGRAVRVDAHDKDAALALGRIAGRARQPHALQAGAEIAALDMPLLQELIDGAIDGRRRDRQGAPARSEHGHAEHASVRIHQRAAFGQRIECEIEPQQAVDGAAALAVPGGAHEGHDAQAGDRCAIMVADGQHEVTGAQRGGITEVCRRQSIRLEAQHSDVGRGVAARKCRIDLAPARQRDLDAFVTLEDFLGGDDDTCTPVNAACRPAAAAVHGDHKRRHAFDGLGGVIGKSNERIVGHELGLHDVSKHLAWSRAASYWPDGGVVAGYGATQHRASPIGVRSRKHSTQPTHCLIGRDWLPWSALRDVVLAFAISLHTRSISGRRSEVNRRMALLAERSFLRMSVRSTVNRFNGRPESSRVRSWWMKVR